MRHPAFLDKPDRDESETMTLSFTHCWVNLSDRWTETVFHDGTRVVAVPEDDAEYFALAAGLGYGTDVEALSQEHELLHTFLAERLTGGASPTLWAVAHGQQEGTCAPVWEQEEEEAMVLAFQRFLRGGSPDTGALRTLIEQGIDLEDLRRDAERLLRPVRPRLYSPEE